MYALEAQMEERSTENREDAGSTPAFGTVIVAERLNALACGAGWVKAHVAGSNPVGHPISTLLKEESLNWKAWEVCNIYGMWAGRGGPLMGCR
jgi:hypothetical protein